MNLNELKYRTLEERKYQPAPTIKTTPDEYCEIFDILFAGGQPILNRFDEELVLEEGEEVEQVFIKNDPVRCEFPYYWFLSSGGNLISVIGSKNPKLFWVLPNLNEYGRLVYKFAYYQDGKRQTHNIKHYNLMGLVYGAERVGLADKLLQHYGLDAIRFRLVEGHHTKGKEFNEPDKIQFLTGSKLKQLIGKKGSHEALRILNKEDPSPEEVKTAMNAISQEIKGPFVAWLRESYQDGLRTDGETSIKPIRFNSWGDYWLSMGRLYDELAYMIETGRLHFLDAAEEEQV